MEIIDFTKGFVPGFVLISGRNETTITLYQARKFYHKKTYKFTKAAKSEIEEADAQDWYDHYVGRAEELSRQNAAADNQI